MVNAIRANATANQRNAERIPTVVYTSGGSSEVTANATGNQDLSIDNALTNYVNELSNITNDVERSHRYTIVMEYDANGLIDNITITY